MNAAWIQALAVAGLVFTVLGLLAYSMCRAARESDEQMDHDADEFEASRQAESDACATSTTNLVLVVLAFAAFAAAQIWLPGPPEAQARQDIADAVETLGAPKAASHEAPQLTAAR